MLLNFPDTTRRAWRLFAKGILVLESNKTLKSIPSFWFPRPYDDNFVKLAAAENNWMRCLRSGRKFEMCLYFKFGANLDIKNECSYQQQNAKAIICIHFSEPVYLSNELHSEDNNTKLTHQILHLMDWLPGTKITWMSECNFSLFEIIRLKRPLNVLKQAQNRKKGSYSPMLVPQIKFHILTTAPDKKI